MSWPRRPLGRAHGRAIGSAAAASSLQRARARRPPRRAGVRSLPSGSGSEAPALVRQLAASVRRVLLLYGEGETYLVDTVGAFFRGFHDGYDFGQEGGARGSTNEEGRADSR